MANGALSELKVIEFAEMVSGPLCGKLFADMGAEVIKIERPGAGDSARRHPPFPDDIPHPEKSGLFLYFNTSKKGITLDPSGPTGSRIFKQLIEDADVLIENHRPGYMKSLGLGYDDLRAINPRLIFTSITPFGQSGPYRDWKGSDLIEFAMSLTGYNTPTSVQDPEEENPLRAPGTEADVMGGTNAAGSTMLAVFHRFATGEGQWLDIPCWQSVVNTAKIEMASYSYGGTPWVRIRPGGDPSPTKDGYIYALWTADAHWKMVKLLLHDPPTLDSELFDTIAGRTDNADVLNMLVREEFAKYDLDYLVTEGQRLGLPFGPVYSVAQAAEHPHLKARGAFVELDHPVAGRFRYPGQSVQMSRTPASPSRAPMLGEHNEEILCGRLGYSKEDLGAMRAAAII